MAEIGQIEQERSILAVDLDEVLALTIDAIITFHNEAYNTSLRVADFTSYNYWEVWGGDREQSIQKVREFYQSRHFLEELQPVPGALEALKELSKEFRLVVVTSRQEIVLEETHKWIAKHFPGVFERIVLGNAFLSEAEQKKIQMRKKSEICAEIGAIALIDDSMTWVEDCLQHGIRAFLFDLNHTYRWNQHPSKLDQYIKRVSSWDEVLQNKALLKTRVNVFDVSSLNWDDRPEITDVANKFVILLSQRHALGKEVDALDFGSGTGVLGLAMANCVRSVTCVDVSEGMINTLNQKIQHTGVTNVHAICKQIERPADLPMTFDLIVSSLVFHHINDVASTVKLLQGLLKPGGSLFVMDLVKQHNHTELFHAKAKHHTVKHHGLNLEDLKSWFRDSGLQDVTAEITSELFKTTEQGEQSFPLFLAHGRQPFPPAGSVFPSDEDAMDIS